jgi:CRISPR-associated protein Cas8a1/Csx13
MAKVTKSPPPDRLTMRLFAPGMSLLHRAGLGGLACSLRAMESQFPEGECPWRVEAQSVTLLFGEPANAGRYLKQLFAFAFTVGKSDGLIRLPGQYAIEPSGAVLADLQTGLTLTFLQHGKVRQLAKEQSTVSYAPEGDGAPLIVQYRKCSKFRHQDGWQDFIERDGTITRGQLRVDGPLSPGAVVRHVAFAGDTAAEDPPERILPLYFAMVGCMSLPVNRGVAALLVPEVNDLTAFVEDRPNLTPKIARECQVANTADAVLQALLRIRGRRAAKGLDVPGCYAMTFRPTKWASQQKSRVGSLYVPKVHPDDKMLDRFQRAWDRLPARIVTRTIKKQSGKGKSKRATEHLESFRADSVIRPLVAENLALGRRWYAGFQKLMTKINPATEKPYRDSLRFEHKGLNDMISDTKMWDEAGERFVVQAVHEAISSRLGQIRAETDGESSNPLSQATKNRWQRFRDKLRLDLAGAKTEAHVRFVLTDLFSRGNANSVLRKHWAAVLPVVRKDWQLARDLGLLALASYSGRSTTDDSTKPPDAPQE